MFGCEGGFRGSILVPKLADLNEIIQCMRTILALTEYIMGIIKVRFEYK